MILRTSLTKLLVEKKAPVKGKINVKTNVTIKDIKLSKVKLGTKDQEVLNFTFEYQAGYEPKIAEISFGGELSFLESPEELKKLEAEWKKNKKVKKERMKKGQVAMEFIMTYGWAILVVLAAIAALAYFGVLSPDRFLPEKCQLPSGIACLDSKLSNSGGAVLVVQNSLGFDISNITVTVNGTGCSASSSSPASLNNGAQGTYTVSCSPTSGTRFSGDITFAYTNTDTSLTHSAAGELVKRVE